MKVGILVLLLLLRTRFFPPLLLNASLMHLFLMILSFVSDAGSPLDVQTKREETAPLVKLCRICFRPVASAPVPLWTSPLSRCESVFLLRNQPHCYLLRLRGITFSLDGETVLEILLRPPLMGSRIRASSPPFSELLPKPPWAFIAFFFRCFFPPARRFPAFSYSLSPELFKVPPFPLSVRLFFVAMEALFPKFSCSMTVPFSLRSLPVRT